MTLILIVRTTRSHSSSHSRTHLRHSRIHYISCVGAPARSRNDLLHWVVQGDKLETRTLGRLRSCPSLACVKRRPLDINAAGEPPPFGASITALPTSLGLFSLVPALNPSFIRDTVLPLLPSCYPPPASNSPATFSRQVLYKRFSKPSASSCVSVILSGPQRCHQGRHTSSGMDPNTTLFTFML